MTLPLEYWETDDPFYGALVSNISETGLLIHSVKNIPVGRELNVRVFFPDGYRFEGFRVIAKVLWKKLHHETDWRVYKYGLEFTRISEEDRQKLLKLINSDLGSKDLSVRMTIGVKNAQSEEAGSYPSLSSGDPSREGEGTRG